MELKKETSMERLERTTKILSSRMLGWLKGLSFLMLLCASTGCEQFKAPSIPQVPEVLPQTPTARNLIALVNRRNAQVRQISSKVSVSIDGVPVKLDGDLQAEKPGKLRMRVSPLGMDSLGADVGCNDKNFWVWIKSGALGTEPLLFFADRNQYANSPQSNQMPLNPQWVFDSLGLIELSADQRFTGPVARKDGRLSLQTTERFGNRLQYVSYVFDPQTGVLNQKAIYNRSGQLIAYINMTAYQYFETIEAAVPTEIEIKIQPDTNNETSISISLSNTTINGLHVDPAIAFAMPNPPNVRKIDVVATPITPASIGLQASPGRNLPSGTPSSSAQPNSFLPFRGALLKKLFPNR